MTEEGSTGAGIPCRQEGCVDEKKELRPSWRALPEPRRVRGIPRGGSDPREHPGPEDAGARVARQVIDHARRKVPRTRETNGGERRPGIGGRSVRRNGRSGTETDSTLTVDEWRQRKGEER